MARPAPEQGRLERLFAFPNPVNEVAARLVAAGVVLMIMATLVFDQPWITAVLAYGFVARTATGPTLSPLAQLVTRVIVPGLALEQRPVDGPPKRFAQAIGAIFTVAAATLALVLGEKTAAYYVLGVLLIPASLEAFTGYCIGCRIFALLIRAGAIPERVCRDCADIWKPQMPRG